MPSVPLHLNFIEQVFVFHLVQCFFSSFVRLRCTKNGGSGLQSLNCRFFSFVCLSFAWIVPSFSVPHFLIALWSMFFSCLAFIDRWRLFDREATQIYNHDFHTIFCTNLLPNQTLTFFFTSGRRFQELWFGVENLLFVDAHIYIFRVSYVFFIDSKLSISFCFRSIKKIEKALTLQIMHKALKVSQLPEIVAF